ncbi:MAG: recombination protein RecR [Candidatus Sungbacteria bacterium]|nr:recombination protein RecR [Candidatus Sungbacteria bacterium]
MYPPSVQKLIGLFLRFPGIGPRQAARFAFYLLGEERKTAQALAEILKTLHDQVGFCGKCYVSAERGSDANALVCRNCRDKARNDAHIMVVEKEADFINIEKTKRFSGVYHILNGTIDPLDSAAPARLHVPQLFQRVESLKKEGQEVEIILATNATTDGDATARYLPDEPKMNNRRQNRRLFIS